MKTSERRVIDCTNRPSSIGCLRRFTKRQFCWALIFKLRLIHTIQTSWRDLIRSWKTATRLNGKSRFSDSHSIWMNLRTKCLQFRTNPSLNKATIRRGRSKRSTTISTVWNMGTSTSGKASQGHWSSGLISTSGSQMSKESIHSSRVNCLDLRFSSWRLFFRFCCLGTHIPKTKFVRLSCWHFRRLRYSTLGSVHGGSTTFCTSIKTIRQVLWRKLKCQEVW